MIHTAQSSDGKLLIGGRWCEAAGGATDAVYDKASGEEIGRAAAGGAADVERAVAAATAAGEEWAAAPAEQRAALMRRCAQLMHERLFEFEDMLMRETGAVRSKGRGEAGAALARFHQSAALPAAATGELLPAFKPGKLTLVQRIPYG